MRLYQTLRIIFTLAMFIPAMWLFMHFIRPYTDMMAERLGIWTFVVVFVIPGIILIAAKYFEIPVDAPPPSRLIWLDRLLRRRG